MSGHAKKDKGASKQDITIMVITFLVGIFAGFYLYTTAFAPQFDEFVGQTESVYEDFVVDGTKYGGNRAGTAPSFQLLADGTFRYLPYTDSGMLGEVREGTLQRTLLREIKDNLTASSLELASQNVTRGDCASYVDGLDYSYSVTIDGDSYTLDTCTTNFRFDSDTYQTLDKLWKYFETLD